MFLSFSIHRIHAAFLYFKSDAVCTIGDSMIHGAIQAVLSIFRRCIHTIWNNNSQLDYDCCQPFAVGAQAARIGSRKHINSTKSILSAARISPFLSEQAAWSLMQYKNGFWLLPGQREDIEAYVATTRLLIVTYHSTRVLIKDLIQVPLVTPVMICPSLFL